MQIVEEVLTGSRRALARIITMVENEDRAAKEALRLLYPHTGRAYVIGITGPPGAGKSTLTDKLAQEVRKQGKTVGIIAVDPTSPFTGGALLGDRIRMQELTLDEGVFIRSMGTRGSLGGLAKATADVVKILDAFGKDVIFIETVGVGQSEIDIVKAADTTVVMLVPGLGDDIQAIKAGILEIGDIFVINKADREGVERLNIELEMMLDLNPVHPDWRPPIIKTVASANEGIGELLETIQKHRNYLTATGALAVRRRERTRTEILDLLEQTIQRLVMAKVQSQGDFATLVDQVARREQDPYAVVRQMLAPVLKDPV